VKERKRREKKKGQKSRYGISGLLAGQSSQGVIIKGKREEAHVAEPLSLL